MRTNTMHQHAHIHIYCYFRQKPRDFIVLPAQTAKRQAHMPKRKPII